MLSVGGIIVAALHAGLSTCCISEAFTYGFHALPTHLQKVSFYSVNGCLLKGKKPCVEGSKDAI